MKSILLKLVAEDTFEAEAGLERRVLINFEEAR